MSAYGAGSYADYEQRARTNIANSGISKLGKTQVTPQRLQEEMTRMGAPRSPWEEAGIPFPGKPPKGQKMMPQMGRQMGVGPSTGFLSGLRNRMGQQPIPQMGQGMGNDMGGWGGGGSDAPMPQMPRMMEPQDNMGGDQVQGPLPGAMPRPSFSGGGYGMPQMGGMFGQMGGGGYGQMMNQMNRPMSQPPQMGRMGMAMQAAKQNPQMNRPMPQRQPMGMGRMQGNRMGGIGPSMM